jgi:hypothetical protein
VVTGEVPCGVTAFPAGVLNFPSDCENFPVSIENFPQDTSLIPGAMALVDEDFRARLNAHASGDDLPSLWTPEHVTTRLIAAYDALHRMRTTSGPSTKPGFWPEVLLDDMERRDLDRVADRAKAQTRPPLPTAYEIELMDEALAWPLQHLTDAPKMADALTLWCACQATERELAPIMRSRVQKAEELFERSIRDLDRNNPGAPARRKAIAGMIAADANERLARVTNDKARARIKRNARALFRTRCIEDGVLPSITKPADAMPDTVITEYDLGKHRHLAAIRVSRALRRRETPVR